VQRVEDELAKRQG